MIKSTELPGELLNFSENILFSAIEVKFWMQTIFEESLFNMAGYSDSLTFSAEKRDDQPVLIQITIGMQAIACKHYSA